MTDYVQKQLAPYLQQAMYQVMKSISDQIAATVSAQLRAGAAGLMGQMATQMSSSFANLASAMRVDASAFAHAIHFNMDAEDLSSLMMSYAKASKLTYDNNLTTLGYADEADPISVKIFPRDFEAKERVLDHIDAYNKQVKASGHDEQAISYTDYMGIIMGSVTDIVNTISLVFIAFVSISLVVSSIMIGIITYISVLERKKEIGILRTIGASKRNVANVFNAETCIEGLIAGVFAIVVVVAVSFPVNAWALAAKQVPNLMSLPVQDALVLIAISVLLTVVAGLLPLAARPKRTPWRPCAPNNVTKGQPLCHIESLVESRSNTFPRSERVKMDPRSVDTFEMQFPAVLIVESCGFGVRKCRCFGGPNIAIHFSEKY